MIRILTGDCREVLKTLPDGSVHCVVTSPPYWGLRDYGTAKWEGGDPECDHVDAPGLVTLDTSSTLGFSPGGKERGEARRIGENNTTAERTKRQFRETCAKCGATRIDSQLGLETTPDEYVANMVAVFREVRRVLRKEGTLWLNLGDSYAGGGNYRGITSESTLTSKQRSNRGARGLSQALGAVGKDFGLAAKQLVGIPWRVAFALQADGWWLRQDIIWAKPNPMPESVRDRCTKSHEYLFLLSKSERYYYDAEAIAEPVTLSTVERMSQPTLDEQAGSDRVPGKTNGPMKAVLKSSGNKARKPASARGVPVARPGNERDRNGCPNTSGNVAGSVPWEGSTRNKRSVWTVTTQPFSEAHFATFPPALIEPCVLAGCPEGGTVLDPFGGAGTTGLVADRHHRDAILIELNPSYADMAQRRISGDAPLFAQVRA